MGGLPAGPVERDEHAYDQWEQRVDALMMLLSRQGPAAPARRRAAPEHREPRRRGVRPHGLLRALDARDRADADPARRHLDRRARAHDGGQGRRRWPTEAATARFRPGDRVRVRAAYPPGHVRTPYYCRGHVGVIERLLRCVRQSRGARLQPPGAAGAAALPCALQGDRAVARLPRGPGRRGGDRALPALAGGGVMNEPAGPGRDDSRGYYRRMQAAVEELLILKGVVTRSGRRPPGRGDGEPQPGARRAAGRARLGRSGLQGARARRRCGSRRRARARGRAAAPHRGREHARRAQRHRVHALLLLSADAARRPAGVVQEPRVPLAGGARSARGARRVRDARSRGRARSASTTPPRTCATSCCRCGPPGPRAGARSGSRRSSPATA